MRATYLFFAVLFVFIFTVLYFSNKYTTNARIECESKNGVYFTSRSGGICIAKEAVRL